jgi:putative transcriptional regulator
MERILTLLALVIAGAIVSGPGRAEPRDSAAAELAREAGPILLVAHPNVSAGWAQTVLFCVPLRSGFHVGLIINRPTEQSLSSLFPEHPASRKVGEPVFFGGPFQPGMLVAMVRGKPESPKGIVPLAKDLYLALEGGTIDRVIETAPASARFYVGMVLWQPGELQEELTAGLWSVRHAAEAELFSNAASALWKRLSVPARGISVGLPAGLAALFQ